MRYNPRPVPETDDLSILRDYLEGELLEIARAVNDPELQVLNLQVLHVEPNKRYEGMTANADGTDWNPGSGKGLYAYRSGAWVKVG